MHEMSIAAELIEQILEEANKNGLSRVDEVEIETGVMRQVIPEAMKVAFEAVAEGTLVEKATLIIKEMMAEAKCKKCEKLFEPAIDNYICPVCHEADVDILKGNDIFLLAIICNEQE